MRPRRILTIGANFIRAESRDPVEMALILVVPLFMAFVFGFADARANDSLPLGVVRTGDSVLAEDLVRQLKDDPTLRVRMFDHTSDLEEALGRGEVYAGVVIPADYDDAVLGGEGATVDVVGDESRGVFMAANAAIVLVIDRESQAIDLARRTVAEPGDPPEVTIEKIRAELATSPVAVERLLADEANTTTEATGFGRLTAGMLIFFLFERALYQSMVLVEDRKSGVIGRMTTTHTRDNEIVAGQILGRFFFQMIQAALVIGSAALLFDVRWGDPLAVTLVVVLFAVVATSISVIVGSRRRALDDAVFARVGVMATFGLLGGCFFSLLLLPDWVRVLGHATPHAWAMDAFNELLTSDAGAPEVIVPLLVLAGMAVGCFLIAVRRLQRAVHG